MKTELFLLTVSVWWGVMFVHTHMYIMCVDMYIYLHAVN